MDHDSEPASTNQGTDVEGELPDQESAKPGTVTWKLLKNRHTVKPSGVSVLS